MIMKSWDFFLPLIETATEISLEELKETARLTEQDSARGEIVNVKTPTIRI